jgi:hypothetical protein
MPFTDPPPSAPLRLTPLTQNLATTCPNTRGPNPFGPPHVRSAHSTLQNGARESTFAGSLRDLIDLHQRDRRLAPFRPPQGNSAPTPHPLCPPPAETCPPPVPPPSIRLSALNTAASFGVLALSQIPVVAALGLTVTNIVLSALALVELLPLISGRPTPSPRCTP